jgi:hypothetical protein
VRHWGWLLVSIRITVGGSFLGFFLVGFLGVVVGLALGLVSYLNRPAWGVRDLAKRRSRQGRQRAALRRDVMTAAKLLVARENFMAATKDGEVFVNVGTRVQANHPLAKAQKQLFEPAPAKQAAPKRAATKKR